MFHLPHSAFLENEDVQIFYGQRTTGQVNTYVWIKPPNKSYLFMVLVSSGGGGGAGHSTAGGGGGGGGGSSGTTRMLLPMWAIPERLLIRPGGAAVAGANGVLSQVTIHPEGNTPQNYYGQSGGTV